MTAHISRKAHVGQDHYDRLAGHVIGHVLAHYCCADDEQRTADWFGSLLESSSELLARADGE
jgi:hypothetical protein